MKYTVVNPETEAGLAVVEHLDSSTGHVWNVALSSKDGKEKKLSFAGAEVSMVGGVCEVKFEGHRFVFPAYSKNTDGSITFATALGSVRVLATRGATLGGDARAASAHRLIKSSMPGKVVKLLCKPGDRVEAGQPLLIIEAMKMENEIRAPQAGIIEEVSVDSGEKVESGELLIKLGPLKVS